MSDPIALLRTFALALCTWREARGESLLGKLLVAQTIENRVTDPRWPETYVGVITQRLQFSAFNRDDPNVTAYPREDDPAWADCVAVASFVLAAPSPLTTANHYHATSVSPGWARADRIVAREDGHVFYRL
jgi:spore germination cell wall hydrolase CwlJ-like protein